MLEKFLRCLVALSLTLLLQACPQLPTRTEVQADVWLQSGLSHTECVGLCTNYCAANPTKCSKSCETNPEQYPNGIYRNVSVVQSDGSTKTQYQIISYCAIGPDNLPIVQHYFNIQDEQFNAILNALLPAPPATNTEVKVQ